MQTPSPWATKADVEAAREALKADIDGLHANLAALHEDLRAVQALLTELRDRRPWWRLFTAGAVVAAVMSVSVGARGSGGFMDGNDLYGFCASSGTFQKCSGYIEAVADAYSPINAYIACEPPSIPAGQAVDVVRRYLATHPEQRYKPAWSLVMVALAEAFPCRR